MKYDIYDNIYNFSNQLNEVIEDSSIVNGSNNIIEIQENISFFVINGNNNVINVSTNRAYLNILY